MPGGGYCSDNSTWKLGLLRKSALIRWDCAMKDIVWALVMSSTQVRILRGISRENPHGEPELVLSTEHKDLRDIMSDKPGRSFSSVGSGRSAMEYASDPVKDATGELIEVAAGLKPWQEAVRRRGFDPERVVEQIKEDQARFEAAGVKVQIGDLLLGAVATAINQGSRE